ncbi:50S ribosomal protein L29 [Bradymonas sediminis]|uniref:Large ribosomal subunit protein uL29 n=1 Tax=Bradymonas sediminis TaxID=1548548 RepID=A0A2Z4FGH9_9DELT|nr:50S ribosomal protein L29 [Bradymonas sediminis]AWV87990.1 50S ribosomal protein L29 [Bradymonas sediminis]TDP77114.1 LSU ribosomal protein L29P [Bradymonas sediminis]
MKPSELREKTQEELLELENQVRDELFRLRMKHFTGQLQNVAHIRACKRNVARIKTVRRELSLAQG